VSNFEGRDSGGKGSDAKPLISQSTILILSGFLIGSIFREYAEPRLGRNILFAGMVGLVAYIGLVFGTYSHRARKRLAAQQQASSDLEHRIERHISESSTPAVADLESRVQHQVEEVRKSISAGEPALVSDSVH